VVDTTDIEKKSLEAHVELCAERYRFLEEKLENVETSITAVSNNLSHVRVTVESMAEKRNDQILNWGLGLIGLLTSAIAFLLVQYVFK
jgi:threonine dehydrogenase-like Zn-dependent dehydrogenase